MRRSSVTAAVAVTSALFMLAPQWAMPSMTALAAPTVSTKTITPKSTCGSSSLSGGYRVWKFTTVGSCTWTPPANDLGVEWIVVAGGGGGMEGKFSGTGGGGGGGAGGVRSGSSVISTSQAVTVGDGGVQGQNGGNSQAFGVTSSGGGNGGGSAGGSGGSGGGGSSHDGWSGAGGAGNTPATTPPQGNKGGDGSASATGAGGGGAGSAGADGTAGGAGGSGINSPIVGVVAGGGGGGGRDSSTAGGAGGSGVGGSGGQNSNGGNGIAGTGGGGGGGGTNGYGGKGGSGIVALRYVAAPTGLAATGGPASASVAFTQATGPTVTNYAYSLDGGAWTTLTAVDASSPVTIPGLVNGQNYSIELRPISSLGLGEESAAVSVRPPGPAAQVPVTSADSVAAGSRLAMTVTRQDASGVNTTVATASDATSPTLTVDLASAGVADDTFYAAASGGSPITQVTIPSGQSSATFYYESTSLGSSTITTSVSGLTSGTKSVTVNPGPAAQFRVDGFPTAQLRNIPFNVTVTPLDIYGNPTLAPGSNSTITLSATGGATLGDLRYPLPAPVANPTAILPANAASVTFYNVLYTGLSDANGLDVTITANGSGSTNAMSGTSAPFSVRGTQMAINSADDSLVANGDDSTTITVRLATVEDTPIVGQTITLSTTLGSITPLTPTTGAQGQVTATLTAGTVAGPATVTARCPGDCPLTRIVVYIAGPAERLAIGTAPTNPSQIGAPFTQPVVIQADDTYGNDAPSPGLPVTVSIDDSPAGFAGGTPFLTGATTVLTNSSGQATFSDLAVVGKVGSYRLRFNSPGMTDITTTLTLQPGPDARLRLTTPAVGSTVGSLFTTQPVIAIDDTGFNLNASSSWVTATLTPGGRTFRQKAVNGVATFTGIGSTIPAGTYTMTYTVGAGATTVSQQITVNKSQQAPLALANDDSVVYGGTLPLVAVGGSGTGAIAYAVTEGTCQLNAQGTAVLPGDAGSLCQVQATKQGDDNFDPVTSLVQTITIAAAPQSTSFTTTPPLMPKPGGTYAPAARSVSVATGQPTGLPVTFTTPTAASICTIDGAGVVAFVGAGNCVVQAVQTGSTNFTSQPSVSQVIAIGSMSQEMNFPQPPDVPLGTSSFSLDATTSAGQPVTFTSDDTSVCEVSSSGVVSVKAPGLCSITAQSNSTDNYGPPASVKRTFPVTPATPGKPRISSISTGDAATTVAVTPPPFDGGEPITGYRVVANPVDGGDPIVQSGCPAAGSPPTCTIEGLTPGVEYTYTVAAITSIGVGPSSTPTPPQETVSAPFAATGLTATRQGTPPGSTTRLDWAGLTNDQVSGTFTEYRVRYREVTTPESPWTTATNPGQLGQQSDDSFTITGLDPAKQYEYEVIAITSNNPDGAIDNTAAVRPSIPEPPSPPRASFAPIPTPAFISAVSTGDLAATVTITPSVLDPAAGVSGYQVVATPVGGGAPVTQAGCPSSGSPLACTVSGLANGTAYTFTVAPITSSGVGPASAPSPQITAGAAPRGVTQLTVSRSGQPTGRAATLGWTPLTDDSISGTFTEYRVLYRQVGSATWSAAGSVANQSAGAFTVTGLDEAAAYEFDVVAITSSDSTQAPANTATAIQTPPGGTGRGIVSWSPPDSDGGLPITTYTVTLTPPAPGTPIVVTVDAANVPPMSTQIGGLTDGLAYTVDVVATNSSGESTGGQSVQVTAPTVPDPPAVAAVTSSEVSGTGGFLVSWRPPTDTGGTRITGYTAVAVPRAQVTSRHAAAPRNSTSVAVASCSSDSTTCFMPATGSKFDYAFVVTAVSLAGASDPSAPYTPTEPTPDPGPGPGPGPSPGPGPGPSPDSEPSAPRLVRAQAGIASATITWAPPATQGSSPVTEYRVVSLPGNLRCGSTSRELTCSITGLEPSTRYTFRVSARNGVGWGAWSAPSNAITPGDEASRPAKPRQVRAVDLGDGRVRVTWKAPAPDGGAAITGYRIGQRLAGVNRFTWSRTGDDARQMVLKGLKPGGIYYIRVRATNDVGPGKGTMVRVRLMR